MSGNFVLRYVVVASFLIANCEESNDNASLDEAASALAAVERLASENREDLNSDGLQVAQTLAENQQLQDLVDKLSEKIDKMNASNISSLGAETPRVVDLSQSQLASVLEVAEDGDEASSKTEGLSWKELISESKIYSEVVVDLRVAAKNSKKEPIFYLLSGCDSPAEWIEPLRLDITTGKLSGKPNAAFKRCTGFVIAVSGNAAIKQPLRLVSNDEAGEKDSESNFSSMSWDTKNGDIEVLMGGEVDVTASVDVDLQLGERIFYGFSQSQVGLDCRSSKLLENLAITQNTGVITGRATAQKAGICVITVSARLGSQQTETAFTVKIVPGPLKRVVRFSSPTVVTEQHVQVTLDENFDHYRALPSGRDIRFMDGKGKSLDFWIEEWNNLDGRSYIWVKVPSAGTSAIMMYYGNSKLSSASNLYKAFSYKRQTELYVTLSAAPAQSLALSSYSQNSSVALLTQLGLVEVGVGKGAITTVPSVGQEVIATNAALSGRRLSAARTYETIVPFSFAGTEFGYPRSRGEDTWQFYNPNSSEVEITITDFNKRGKDVLNDHVDIIPPRAFKAVERNVKSFGIVTSNLPVLVFYSSRAGTRDGSVLIPAAKKLFGVSGGTSYLGILRDETDLVVHYSDGTKDEYEDLSKGENFALKGKGVQGKGLAIYIESNQPVVATSQADSDGTESVGFWTERDLASEYIIPTEAQYIAVATLYQNQNVTVIDPSGNIPAETQTSTFEIGAKIGKLWFGDDKKVKYSPGTKIFSEYPFYVYYEYANRDETMVTAVHHARKYIAFPPKVSVEQEIKN